MTAQFPDRIHYLDADHALLTNPLGFATLQPARGICFAGGTCTACWRGYVASWKIMNDRLYLVKIRAKTRIPLHERSEDDAEKYRHATLAMTLADLFPDRPAPIFADWFTEELRIGEGDIVNYFHGGYASQWATEHYLTVEAGVVTAIRTVENRDPNAERQRRFDHLLERAQLELASASDPEAMTEKRQNVLEQLVEEIKERGDDNSDFHALRKEIEIRFDVEFAFEKLAGESAEQAEPSEP